MCGYGLVSTGDLVGAGIWCPGIRFSSSGGCWLQVVAGNGLVKCGWKWNWLFITVDGPVMHCWLWYWLQ